jgi:opacity protein-like surface antigen
MRTFVPRGGSTSVLAAAVLAVALGAPATASAQVDQVFTIQGGFLMVEGEDARSDGDVLYQNLSIFTFDIDDFNGGIVGAEWALGLGNYVEAGVGGGYYQRTVDTVYWDLVDEDGTEIEQELKLRMAPITVSARVFPLGRRIPVQPYVGGGLAIIPWRYSESGEFVDADDLIFQATYKDSGWAYGPVFYGGVRFGGDIFFGGGEFRYHNATADLDPDIEFFGSEIDLGAYQFLFTFGWRF